MSVYQFPLQMSFKILAFGPQIYVRDTSGREVLYVHQKALKLKEDISVYSDSSKSSEKYRVKADRIIDFSARYNFTDSLSGMSLGAVKREGMRSIFKASYNIMGDGDTITHHIKEDNGWVRVMDLLLREVPIVGIFSGYFFNPTYTLYQSSTETPIFRIKKMPAFLEGKFEIEKLAEPMGDAEEARLLLGIVVMTLLERMRG
jgi:hypothetical protein